MEELGADKLAWDLQEHLDGCLAAYQAASTYGSAVHFALEAISGIAHDKEIRARDTNFDQKQRDPNWIINPRFEVGVPWIWIKTVAAAWSKYKHEGGPLGRAFGLEGGQGKSPVIDNLEQMRDQRAIARWIAVQSEAFRSQGNRNPIEQAIQSATEKFGKSAVTIRRIWSRFGRAERRRLRPT
jgi:hypothetical protein